MLPLRALAWAVAAVVVAAYVQVNGFPAWLLHPREQALAELQYSPTTTPLLVGLGACAETTSAGGGLSHPQVQPQLQLTRPRAHPA